jgi:hypothetical protein
MIADNSLPIPEIAIAKRLLLLLTVTLYFKLTFSVQRIYSITSMRAKLQDKKYE